jgi:AAA family ATP:ADP antiporter
LILKPVRSAVYLHYRRFDEAPEVFVMSAAVMAAAAFVINAVAARWSRRRLIELVFGGSILLLLVFRVWYGAGLRFGVEAFTIWIGAYNLAVIYLFWAVAADRFSPEQSARLYGMIGAGGVLGSVVGSLLASVLAERIGTDALIVLAVLILGAAGLLLRALEASGAPEGTRGTGTPPLQALAAIFRSSYLVDILLIVVLSNLTASVFDYQFSAVVQSSVAGQDAKTGFYARFLLAQNLVALLGQGVVRPINTRWGPAPGMLSLVVVDLIGAAATGWMGWSGSALLLPVLVAFRVLAGGLSYSIHQSSKESLYTPLDATEKYQAKVFIDAVGFRVADALAGLLLMAANLAGFSRSGAWLGMLVLMAIPLVLFSAVPVLRVSRAFIRRAL